MLDYRDFNRDSGDYINKIAVIIFCNRCNR